MSRFIEPEHALNAQLFRRMGGMDKAKMEYVCQQCHKPFKFSARDAHSMKLPMCPNCGPGPKVVYSGLASKRTPKDCKDHG
jgi:DNA-directed RNA polymerase subunit RPC12/RpoP